VHLEILVTRLEALFVLPFMMPALGMAALVELMGAWTLLLLRMLAWMQLWPSWRQL
jgi:hypothetical protein